MQRPSPKQFWLWVVSVLLLAAILASLPPVRVQYHKWRLEWVKGRKTRLLAGKPALVDQFWLAIGIPVSGQELDESLRSHEDALVRFNFLQREKLPMQMLTDCPQTLQTLDALRGECPWYHAETLSSSNFVLTACPQMMQRWRKRAQELGWSLPKS
jgi:hypothetical protein